MGLGGTADSFGPGELIDQSDVYDLNIVNGQTIESQSGPEVSLVGSAGGSLNPATVADLAGSWIGSHSFAFNGTTSLITDVTFSGTTVAGETRLEPGDFSPAIAGSITEFGDTSLLTFTWNGNTYNGFVSFVPGSTSEILFVGETANEEADNRTIASRMARQ